MPFLNLIISIIFSHNLKDEESKGLKSLKKRVAEGSIVVCQTDKSSRFAIMSIEEYEEAGRKHTDKDTEVSLNFMQENQRRINGHISMLLKTFMVGANWGHEARHRATKLTYSLSVAPLYLLFKDHKGWSVSLGTPPPTRPVASAGKGQNDHLSETVSQVLEPVANVFEGGMEVNSTQDMLNKIDKLNTDGDLELEDINLQEVDEELERMEKEKQETFEVDVDDVAEEEQEVLPEGMPRAERMRNMRDILRQKKNGRKVNMFKPVEGYIEVQKMTRRALTRRGQRKLVASEVENRVLQDRSDNMVIVGADVEALYPSLEDVQVAEIIYKAVMESEVKFDGVNHQEGARYIALTSSEEECRTGPLRRVLPRRRFEAGTRPGVTGTGPMGPESCDQEQWVFKKGIKLTELEKRLIVATTLKKAVLMLFRSHVYSFSGKYYLQKAGGPIGLRSTCAIARLVMMWWDTELMSVITTNNMTVEERARYMDDIRLWLFNIRLGWRWCEGQLCFSSSWRKEEMELGMTGLAKTMEILRMIMNSICSFLNLTMESEVDFGGVLPSLDLNLWIRKEDNRTLYAFYEKPMATNMMIQKKSAMPENMRMSSLNQEMYRRMTNTSELVTLEQRLEIVDQYGQKLTNSGYGLEQIRRAMVGGLVRYERRLLQSLSKPGVGWRPLHEGAKYNASNRRIKKMLAKSNWFKRKRDKGQDQGDGDGVEKEGSPSKRSRREDDEDSDLRGRDQMQEVKLTCDKTSSQRQSVGKHNQKHSKNSNSQHKVKQDSQQAGSDQKSRPGRISTGQGKTSKPDPPTISVMFVDQTVGGVLAKMLQEVEDRLASITGYRVRITETSGSQLCRILPNTNPWGTKDCERGNCYTCSQSGEKMEDCKRRNILCVTRKRRIRSTSPSGRSSSRWMGYMLGSQPGVCLKELENIGRMCRVETVRVTC